MGRGGGDRGVGAVLSRPTLDEDMSLTTEGDGKAVAAGLTSTAPILNKVSLFEAPSFRFLLALS